MGNSKILLIFLETESLSTLSLTDSMNSYPNLLGTVKVFSKNWLIILIYNL